MSVALFQAQLEQAEKEAAVQTDWTAVLRKYLNLQVLDRTAVDELIPPQKQAFSAAARSVFSQATPRSSRPIWP